ncbi:MAG: hypothetical protein NZ849_01155 [Meiothermus sp.]|uniref:hypothetical protein n=1 Tax=Meiothermus sp. TaxID=1955249 RepID=UPI0025D34CF0|nr:hypothetical protein [Meiothermus sp.]MCS7058267.1 hypothetical protein [Meiothermus sp.]MCS7193515.1 hypothetical protein [Meiothermus sp.]
MRRMGYLLLGHLVLLLTACPGPGADGTGTGGTQVTVRLEDPRNALLKALYRVGSDPWRTLTFQNAQASFRAPESSEYEVAARCAGPEPFLLFHKARVSQTRSLSLVCSAEGGPPTVPFTLNVQLPSQIGARPVQDGDLVFAYLGPSELQGTVSSGAATVNLSLPTGRQTLLVSVFRISGSPPSSLVPIGGRLVGVEVVSGGSSSVDAQGWQAFTPRSIAASLPPGFQPEPVPLVAFFKDGMKSFGVAGAFDRYGVLPDAGGVYLGILLARSGSLPNQERLVVFKDTGGQDWNANPPQPWGAGQFTPSGTRFTFGRTDAQAYLLELQGLVRDSATALKVHVHLHGGFTSYELPSLGQELNYTLAPANSEVSYEVTAAVRGSIGFVSQNLAPGAPSEALLRNIDIALAVKGGTYRLP